MRHEHLNLKSQELKETAETLHPDMQDRTEELLEMLVVGVDSLLADSEGLNERLGAILEVLRNIERLLEKPRYLRATITK